MEILRKSGVCVCAVGGGGGLGVWALYALLEKWEINLLWNG